MLIDVLDDLLAPLVLEIDIDVRRLPAIGADEALEKKVDLRRVHPRNAEAVADHRVGRRAAALAEDLPAPREGDDVVDREEIGRVIQLLNQRELLVDEAAHFLRHAIGKFLAGTELDKIDEVGVRCLTRRHRLIGGFVFEVIQIEGACGGNLQRASQRHLVSLEEPHHLMRWLKVALGIGCEPKSGIADAYTLADASQDVLQRAAMGRVIENVACRHERHVATPRQGGKRRNVGAIFAAVGVRGGEIESGGCEARLEAPQLGLETCGIRGFAPAPALWRDCNEDLAVCGGSDVLERENALAFVGAPLTERKQSAKTAIGRAVRRQTEDTWRVGEIEADTDNELETDLLCGHMRAHDAGKRIAVRHRQRRKTQRLSLLHQLMRVRAPAQEGEVGRHLQLGIGSAHDIEPLGTKSRGISFTASARA